MRDRDGLSMVKAMFRCVECGHAGSIFRACSDRWIRGSCTLQAVCPVCGSHLVDAIPGIREEGLILSCADNKGCLSEESVQEKVFNWGGLN